jgi:(p)ppGpp synthase/HD superfamily hydrolase
MDNAFELAYKIALDAHEGQVDKSGEPYICHPYRVMNNFVEEDKKIVSILHDTVEDTNVTLDFLKENGFSDEIIDAIDAISKRKNENRKSYIQRVSENKIATSVKLFDLMDNMNVSRIKRKLEDKDIERLKKYHEEYLFLMDKKG